MFLGNNFFGFVGLNRVIVYVLIVIVKCIGVLLVYKIKLVAVIKVVNLFIFLGVIILIFGEDWIILLV